MSELQIGLLAIGVLVVAGVLAYNRIQERGAQRAAEKAFPSGRPDVLLEEPPATPVHAPAPRPAPAADPEGSPLPDPRIDYIVEVSFPEPAPQSALQEPWRTIERRHAHRALLAGAADGKSWRAALQLVSRDGAVGEADLIEFRAAVEALAAALAPPA